MDELAATYEQNARDPAFQVEPASYLHRYCGRPTPLFHAQRLSVSSGVRGSTTFKSPDDLLKPLHEEADQHGNIIPYAR